MKANTKTMMKKITLGALASLLTMSAQAETYNFSVEIDSRLGEQPLTTTVLQNMNYPVLGVTDATEEGAYCIANNAANSRGFDNRTANEANSLCPSLTADSFKAQFSGVKGAILHIDYSMPIQEKGGFRFAYSNGAQHVGSVTRTLSTTDGTYTWDWPSRVTLVDRSLVTDSVLEFSLDLTAAYQ